MSAKNFSRNKHITKKPVAIFELFGILFLMNSKKSLLVILPTIAIFSALALLVQYWPRSAEEAVTSENLNREEVLGESNTQENVQLANPASQYCQEQGGTSEIIKNPDGDSGVCKFSNGKQCDEWNFYHRKCFSEAPALRSQIKQGTYSAVIKTSVGDLTIDLFNEATPVAVNNFVSLASQGYYDNVIFHRIIEDFMVQTGDPLGTGRGGPGYKFDDEMPIIRNYSKGTVAMANSGPNTNGSQFFIMTQDNETLPKNYVIFGEVIEGYRVLEALAATPVTANEMGEVSKPVEPPVIEYVTVYENGEELNNRPF